MSEILLFLAAGAAIGGIIFDTISAVLLLRIANQQSNKTSKLLLKITSILTGISIIAIILLVLAALIFSFTANKIFRTIFSIMIAISVLLFIAIIVLTVVCMRRNDISSSNKKTIRDCLILSIVGLVFFIVSGAILYSASRDLAILKRINTLKNVQSVAT